QEIVGGWYPAGVGISRGVGIGYLGERDVLGETTCREPLGGAREERQERSSAGIRTRRAPREEDGDARATEGFLEMRAVLGRRTEEDGDAVEGHAARRGSADAARDLDALAGLPGPGAERHRAVECRGGRGRVLEEMRLRGG